MPAAARFIRGDRKIRREPAGKGCGREGGVGARGEPDGDVAAGGCEVVLAAVLDGPREGDLAAHGVPGDVLRPDVRELDIAAYRLQIDRRAAAPDEVDVARDAVDLQVAVEALRPHVAAHRPGVEQEAGDHPHGETDLGVVAVAAVVPAVPVPVPVAGAAGILRQLLLRRWRGAGPTTA